MKKLSAALVLLILIPCLTVWVGASSWYAFKKKPPSAEVVATQMPLAAASKHANPAASASKTKNTPIVRAVAADPNSYINELRKYPELAPLASDPSVQLFVQYIGRDFSAVFMDNQVGTVYELAHAASVLVPKLTECLDNPAKCGVTDLSADYAVDSSHPLETILASALDCVRDAESYDVSAGPRIPSTQIIKDFSISQNNVQIEASEILADRNLGDQELSAVFAASQAIQGPAKVEFFRIFGPLTAKRNPAARNAYMITLSQTLRNGSDPWTAQKVFLSLQDFRLSAAEFQSAATNACAYDFGYDSQLSRQRLQAAVQDNARRNGYDVDFGELCGGGDGGRR